MNINKNDKVDVAFLIRNSETNEVVYQHSTSEPIKLSPEEPLFEILKVLINKNKDYHGNFQFEKIECKESNQETLPRNGILKKLRYSAGQIIRYSNNPYKYGLIKDLNDKEIILETINPFRRQNLNLKISVKKVINN